MQIRSQFEMVGKPSNTIFRVFLSVVFAVFAISFAGCGGGSGSSDFLPGGVGPVASEIADDLVEIGVVSSGNILKVPEDYPTIQAAVDVARDGDTVLVSPGVYQGDGNSNLSIPGKLISIRSTRGADNTIIDGQYNTNNQITFHAGYGEPESDKVFDGFTIRNFPQYAIFVEFVAICTIQNCKIMKNGYGFKGYGRSQKLFNNEFTNNGLVTDPYGYYGYPLGTKLPVGYPLYIAGLGSFEIRNNVIKDNIGSGITVMPSWTTTYSMGTIENNIITDNNASSWAYSPYFIGGGIRVQFYLPLSTNEPIIIRNNIISRNSSFAGGGMYLKCDNLIVENNVITKNYSQASFTQNTGFGGGAFIRGVTNNIPGSDAKIIFRNNTVFNNAAKESGGGITMFGTEKMTVASCIIFKNEALIHKQIFLELGEVNPVSFCDVEGGWFGEGNIAADPRFMKASIGDFRLGSYSECIDSANGSLASENDILGNPRFDDPDVKNFGSGFINYVDMGAYERQRPSNSK